MEGDFVAVGEKKHIGWLWKIAFKAPTYAKFGMQLPYGAKGVSHGEVCAWFESTQNFATKSACDGREPTPPNNDKVLLQCQEKEGDSK